MFLGRAFIKNIHSDVCMGSVCPTFLRSYELVCNFHCHDFNHFFLFYSSFYYCSSLVFFYRLLFRYPLSGRSGRPTFDDSASFVYIEICVFFLVHSVMLLCQFPRASLPSLTPPRYTCPFSVPCSSWSTL